MERGIKFFIAAAAIILLDRYTSIQATVLGFTMQGVAFALLGFAAYYILKAVWGRPSDGGGDSN